MPAYKAPLDDIRFLLHDVHDVAQLSALPGFEEATPDMIDAVLVEGAKICEEVLFRGALLSLLPIQHHTTALCLQSCSREP